jgi:hypothetical protein
MIAVLVVAPLLATGAVALTASGPAGAKYQPGDAARGVVWAGIDRDQPNGPCRGGYRMASTTGERLCTHGPDAAPDGIDVRQRRGPDPAQAASTTPTPGTAQSGTVQCYGTGSDGYRVQLLYAHAANVTDRFGQYASSFAQWAAAVDAVFNNSAGETGGSSHVRFVTGPSCNPVVLDVGLSNTGGDNMTNTINELHNMGYNRSDRRYLVWMDANVYCGIAQVYGDDSPGQSNLSNGNSGVQGEVARVDNGCWGAAGQSVEAHELMHTLGGVQTSAPHSTPYYHCYDEYDRMCYADGSGVAMRQICPTSHENLFDCNHDDYFYAGTPPVGNYLATHWNTANSVFLQSLGGAPPPAPTTGTKPSPPLNLTAAWPGSGHGIALKWQAPTSGNPVTNYKIFRSRYSGQEVYLATVGNVLSFTDTTARTGLGYFYKVKALNPYGTSSYSNQTWDKAA